MLAGFGKFVLVLSLCLQGSLLIQGNDVQKNFNASLISVSKAVPQLNFIQQQSQHFDYIRFALAGLYCFSILSLVTRSCFIPFVTALGVILSTFVSYYPTLASNPTDLHATIGVLKNVCILGGLVYLMGSSCSKEKAGKQKTD